MGKQSPISQHLDRFLGMSLGRQSFHVAVFSFCYGVGKRLMDMFLR